MASTHRAAPASRAAISPASIRPVWTVRPGAAPCSAAPYPVATQTVTAAPSAASRLDSRRPSVVPLNTTITSGTPGA